MRPQVTTITRQAPDRAASRTPVRPFGRAEAFLTIRDVLEFATIEGARATGLERKIGTLTPGKEADIIRLRADRPDVMPMNNAAGAVVTDMGGPQNVDTVRIARKVMECSGEMVGLDLTRLQRLGDDARDRVYAAAMVKNSWV